MLMQKEKIKQRVQKLIDRYHTCNPFKLAELCGLHVTYAPLQEMHGLYMKYRRVGIIIISTEAPEEQLNFICAHELGHALLHDGLNIHSMTSRAHFSAGRYEREADFFATELLMQMQLAADADFPDEGFSVYAITHGNGIPDKVAEAWLEYHAETSQHQQIFP